MRVETKELEYCKLHVFYEGDVKAVKEKQKAGIKTLKKLNVPGFRPGKAPDDVIKIRCKKQLANYVAREMASQAYDDVLFETKAKSIGYPQFLNVNLNGDVFSCEMTLMVKPKFDLKDYKGLEIPKPHLPGDVNEKVEKVLQDLRVRHGEAEPYKDGDFLQDGDQVTMSFTGSIDGQEFEGSTQEGILYTVGENRWPGFDENLYGMNPDEEREFDLKFPDELPVICGKTAKFKVTLHMGMKRTPCPLDDELAKKVGLNTFDEVRQKVAVIVNDQIRNQEASLVRQQISARLVEGHDFQLPEWLTSMEAQHIAMQNGIDWKTLSDEEKEMLLKQASKNVKLSLILDSVREEELESVLSDLEAVEAIKNQVKSRGVDPDNFIVEKQKSGALMGMMAAIKDEFTLQWLVDQAKLVE